MTEIEISCLPKDLPEFIELDVTELELNQVLHLSDVTVPEGVTFTELAHERDPAVVAINPPRREEVEEEEVAEEAVAVEGEEAAAAPEAGEAPSDDSES